MAQMLTINPHKRKARRKKPSAKQLAARKRFAAMARARAKASKVKSNPKRRRKSRKASSPVKRNPSPAPMAKRSKSARRRRSSGFRFFRRKAKRNPIVSRSFINATLSPAAVGALGATINDMAVGYLVTKLPNSLQAPEMRQFVKGITAVGLGMLASKTKLASAGTIKRGVDGALTCALHDAFRTQAQKFLPSVPLGEYMSEVTGPYNMLYANGMGEQLSCGYSNGYDDDGGVSMDSSWDGPDGDFDVVGGDDMDVN